MNPSNFNQKMVSNISNLNQPQNASQSESPAGRFLNSESVDDDINGPFIKAMAASGMMKKSIMGRGLVYDNFRSAVTVNSWTENYPYFLRLLSVEDGFYKEISRYRLPINPQDVTISTPFATKLTFTSRGVTEEHNGVTMKQIVLNGTTGIYIERDNMITSTSGTTTLGSVFSQASTQIASIKNMVSSASNVINQKNKNEANRINDMVSGGSESLYGEEQINEELRVSGYYQYHVLRMFLEHYAELKKGLKSSKYRITLWIPKDKVEYLIKLDNFVTRRSVASPQEYLYTLQCTAWGTVSANQLSKASFVGVKDPLGQRGESDIDQFRKLLNNLQTARRAVQKFKNLIAAVRSDINNSILGPINDTILLCKEIGGAAKSLADLPDDLKRSFTATIVRDFLQIAGTNPEIFANDTQVQNRLQVLHDEILNHADDPPEVNIINADRIKNSGAGRDPKNSFSSPADATSVGSAPNRRVTSYYKDPIPFDSKILEVLDPATLNPSKQQQDAINKAVDKAKNINKNDIIKLVNTLEQVTTALSTQIGIQHPTDEEWDLLYSLQDTISTLYGSLSEDLFQNSTNEEDNAQLAGLQLNPLDFWSEAAKQNNLVYNNPVGKFAIPFPFNGSLQELALQYLGDAERWTEIVAINNLQYPYIDEEGFYINLISNANGNQLHLAEVGKLYIGQSVYLMSDTKPTIKRDIIKISQISQGNYIITVSGESDLTGYTMTDMAKIKAYLPYTVNSMKKVFIPTQNTSDSPQVNTKVLTFIKEDETLVNLAKIDFLLDGKYDLAMNNDGFLNLAFGTTNLVQAAKIKMITPAGSLLLHPGFGAGITVGESVANINVDDYIQRINASFKNDPRFQEPDAIRINIQEATASMSVDVAIAEIGSTLPITFPLSR